MISHLCPTAPGKDPWQGAGLVEGPALSGRHGLPLLLVSCDARSARRPPETITSASGRLPAGESEVPTKDFSAGGRLPERESPAPTKNEFCE